MSDPARVGSKELNQPDKDDSSLSDIGAEERAIQHPPEKSLEVKDDPFLVKWNENDPENPYNFGIGLKCRMTFILGMLAMVGSLGSSIVAPAQTAIATRFNLNTEVSFLPVTIYVLGFVFGPSIFAPISELYGRRWSLLPPLVGLVIFSIGSAVSQSLAALLVTRFFGGVCGSSPVSNVNAALGDIWVPRVRGTAVALYAVCVIGGQLLGPLIGSAITVNPNMGWRWTEYILAIWTGAITLLSYFFMPEVYAPYLLKKRAQKLRKETGDSRYWHPLEKEKITAKSIVTKHFSRPIHMFFTEPAVTAITLYASFTFGLLYMTLELYPIVFREHRGWSLVVSSVPFLAMFVGVLFALVINIGSQRYYRKRCEAAGGKAVPEARCPPMFFGGLLFAIGLFLFGWTSDPNIQYFPSLIGCACIGAGMNVTFQQCINFLVDTYRVYAASAVSANTLMRSILAATLPLAVNPMVKSLGVGPSMSLLGGVAVLALPLPFIFYKYGARLREKSKFAEP